MIHTHPHTTPTSPWFTPTHTQHPPHHHSYLPTHHSHHAKIHTYSQTTPTSPRFTLTHTPHQPHRDSHSPTQQYTMKVTQSETVSTKMLKKHLRWHHAWLIFNQTSGIRHTVETLWWIPLRRYLAGCRQRWKLLGLPMTQSEVTHCWSEFVYPSSGVNTQRK